MSNSWRGITAAESLKELFMALMQAWTQTGCVGTNPLAGQIITKSCSFSPETEFTPLILASKLDCFLRFAPTPLYKITEIRTPFFKSLRTGL